MQTASRWVLMACCSADTYGELRPGECPAEERTVSEDIGVGYADALPLLEPLRPDEKAGKMADRPGRRIPSLLSSGIGVA